MLRPINMAAVLLVVVTFVGLYRLSYEVRQLDRQLANINQSVLDEAEAIRLLEAEWSYLNRPARLEVLADDLGLEPVHIGQFLPLDAIPDADIPEKEEPLEASSLIKGGAQ